MITIVIALDSLYNDFKITTINLLKTGNKIIDQIQNMLPSQNIINISKHIVRIVVDLAMAFRDNIPKIKVNSNEQYFNIYKLSHFGQVCSQLDKQ